jgi:uncharacterized membrane protein
MVATYFDHHDCSRRFLIRPNCSLRWREVVRFYLAMVVVSFGIAVAFALQGAWLVLPFAGLEMAVLGAALYLVARRSYRWQVVSVHTDRIEIAEHGRGQQRLETFQRAWARVRLQPAAIQGHPSRLTIGSHGRRVEIGGCLNEDDKKYLAHELSLAVRSNY